MGNCFSLINLSKNNLSTKNENTLNIDEKEKLKQEYLKTIGLDK